MDLEAIKRDYKNTPTVELVKLVSAIKTLEPAALSLLQDELIKRGEIVKALRINDYLISIKHQLNNDVIFKSIVKLRKKGFSEVEIDKQLIDQHKIDSNYLELMKYSLVMRGKGDITLGVCLIITSLILGILYFTITSFLLILLGLLIILGLGVWLLSVGSVKIKQQ